MSKKQLLSENTVRRFMKLASIGTLTDQFITESDDIVDTDTDDEAATGPNFTSDADTADGSLEEVEIDQDLEDLFEALEEELPDEEPAGAPDLGAVDAEAEIGADADMDATAEPAMEEADMSLSQEEAEVLIELGRRLEAAMGEGDPEAEEPVEEPVEEPAEAPIGDEAAPEGPEEDEAPLQEKLVNEVLRRVTKRIIREKLNK